MTSHNNHRDQPFSRWMMLAALALLLAACARPTPLALSNPNPRLPAVQTSPPQPTAPGMKTATSTPPKTTAPTVPPPAGTPRPVLSLDTFRNMTFCKVLPGCFTMVNGRFQQYDVSGRLLDQYVTGDLNGDGWDDALVFVQYTVGGALQVYMVAVLNQAGKPFEAAAKVVAGDDARVEGVQIENGQVIYDNVFTAPIQDPQQPDPHYTIIRAEHRDRLDGENLVEEQMTSWAQDGTAWALVILPPASQVISGSSFAVTLQLNADPYQRQLLYDIYDATGSGVYSGKSPVTKLASGAYQMPIDLSWAKPGALRIVIQDFYSTPHLGNTLALTALTIDYQPSARAIPPPLFAPNSFHMIDAAHGWAVSAAAAAQRLLRTDDGGVTWKTIALPFDGYPFLSVLDASTAWAYPANDNPSIPHRPLVRTTDGGKTWQALPDMPASQGGPHFFDLMRGVLIDQPGGYFMSGQTRFIIFRTTDGGQTWERQFDNTGGGAQENQQPGWGVMTFRDLDNGFVSGSGMGSFGPNALYLMRSYDGGRSWLDQSSRLTKPPVAPETDLSEGPLTFFGEQAILPLVISKIGVRKSVRLYLSPDGGSTWRLSSEAAVQPDSQPVVTPLSAKTILIWDGKTLQQTDDGGVTWVPQPFQASFSGLPAGIQFISPQVAFALTNDHNPDADSTTLYKTSDGGHTWQKAPVKILP